jgi:hypothetical protein
MATTGDISATEIAITSRKDDEKKFFILFLIVISIIVAAIVARILYKEYNKSKRKMA